MQAAGRPAEKSHGKGGSVETGMDVGEFAEEESVGGHREEHAGAVSETLLIALKTEMRIVRATSFAAEGPSTVAMEVAAMVSDCAERAGPSATKYARFASR